MPLFAISYESNRKGNSSLTGRLDELRAVRAQSCFWLLDFDTTADVIRRDLARHMESQDRLMVIEFANKPARTRSLKGTSAWINRRFNGAQ